MVVDLRKSMIPDIELIQGCIIPHLMAWAMIRIPLDGDGKEVNPEWLKILGQESVMPLLEIPRQRQVGLAKKVESIGRKVLNQSGPADCFKELTLSICLALLELVRTGKMLDINNQHSTIAVKITEEALEFEDWGSMKRAKAASRNILKELYENSLFKQDKREDKEDGPSIIS